MCVETVSLRENEDVRIHNVDIIGVVFNTSVSCQAFELVPHISEGQPKERIDTLDLREGALHLVLRRNTICELTPKVPEDHMTGPHRSFRASGAN